MRKALVMLMLIVCNAAGAEQGGFVSLGTIGESKYYVGTGGNANRVGTAVLAYVHHVMPNFSSSAQYLIACDASWVSDAIRFSMTESNASSPQELEASARADSMGYPLDLAELNDWQQSQLAFASALRPHVREICKGAAPEPKNITIPIAVYAESGKLPGGALAVLTGTVVRKGGLVDSWVRTSFFNLEPAVFGGKPFILDGVAQTKKVATGNYEMRRMSFDCANRSLSVYQELEYKKDGSVVNQWSAPRGKLQYNEVVPTSVGESQLDAICKIYGGK